MRKLLLTLGTISAIALPIATVISCNSSDKKQETPNIDGNPDMSLIKPITPKVGENGKGASTVTTKPEEHKDTPEVVGNTYHQRHFDDEYPDYKGAYWSIVDDIEDYAFGFYKLKGKEYFLQYKDWEDGNDWHNGFCKYRFGDDVVIMNYHELFDYAHEQELLAFHITDLKHLSDSDKAHISQFSWTYNKHHDPAQ